MSVWVRACARKEKGKKRRWWKRAVAWPMTRVSRMRSWGETFMNVYSARGLADQALRSVTSHVRTLQTPHP